VSYDPSSRYYVGGVTGYHIGHAGFESYGGIGRGAPTIWYVLDSVPPRTSWRMGPGESGRSEAELVAGIWNRDEVAWWTAVSK